MNAVITPTPARRRLSPLILLIAGIVAGVATAITGLLALTAAAVTLGAATAVSAIWLTFLIASRQAEESSDLRATVSSVNEAVKQMQELLLKMAEQESAQDYEAPGEDEAEAEAERPDYSDVAIERLRAEGVVITADHVIWRRKQPSPALPGNHGWFVELDNSTTQGRWYVRKAHGLTVRRAMPRDFLDALKETKSVDPQTIKLDFQLKEHGLAAWYARTYSGDLWKVWRSARKWNDGIMIDRVDQGLSSS